ncbi:hypothetical protein T8K17_11445 [Thalassobaculum sp. OXR-137]|uniref:hypothetical protein n=1 Tax=Thalassobaculum sp. OXR-137 TaxID=3100173 RepID=UPI002AC8D9F6|nr:hypothetical protein [Thalassobaculum sp. OXR-137]WPZ36749.1 hypothetical protein T8K17_11445 [Thalassobaculum sp. OXR-137]
MEDAPPRAYTLDNYSLADLDGELKLIEAGEKLNKTRKAEIQDELERRLGAQLDAALAADNKDTGTATVILPGGGTAKRTIKKDVKYDGAALISIASTMPWETASLLFKITATLPEANYAGLVSNPDLKAKIDAARTVTPKAEAIKLDLPATAP